jgi:hypothetical protein
MFDKLKSWLRRKDDQRKEQLRHEHSAEIEDRMRNRNAPPDVRDTGRSSSL